MQKIILSLPFLLAVLFLQTGCESEKKSSIDQSEIIVEAIPLTEIDDYLNQILNLEEYNVRMHFQSKTRVYYSFDARKLTVNDSVYYHVELWKTRIPGMEESTIPKPEIVAYFRVLPNTQKIFILDRKSKHFIELGNTKGKALLENSMK